jgi:hypothetical protein
VTVSTGVCSAFCLLLCLSILAGEIGSSSCATGLKARVVLVSRHAFMLCSRLCPKGVHHNAREVLSAG